MASSSGHTPAQVDVEQIVSSDDGSRNAQHTDATGLDNSRNVSHLCQYDTAKPDVVPYIHVVAPRHTRATDVARVASTPSKQACV